MVSPWDFLRRFSVAPECLRSEKSPEVASGKLEASKVLGQERRVAESPRVRRLGHGSPHTRLGASDLRMGRSMIDLTRPDKFCHIFREDDDEMVTKQICSILQIVSGVIKHGWLENTLFIADCPIETPVSGGFPSLPGFMTPEGIPCFQTSHISEKWPGTWPVDYRTQPVGHSFRWSPRWGVQGKHWIPLGSLWSFVTAVENGP